MDLDWAKWLAQVERDRLVQVLGDGDNLLRPVVGWCVDVRRSRESSSSFTGKVMSLRHPELSGWARLEILSWGGPKFGRIVDEAGPRG